MPRPKVFLACLAAPLLSAQNGAEPRAVFAGSVIDSATRQPIPKVSVRVNPVAEGRPAYAATTDSSGRFRFVAIQPGEYRVRVQHRGYVDRWKNGVRLAAGDALADVTITLEPKAVITGRVVDAEGTPLAGAAVSIVVERWVHGARTFKRGERTEGTIAASTG